VVEKYSMAISLNRDFDDHLKKAFLDKKSKSMNFLEKSIRNSDSPHPKTYDKTYEKHFFHKKCTLD
jgi:hypothetical protein